MAGLDPDSKQVDSAVAEGGAYEVIRRRLAEQGQTLKRHAGKLNEARMAEFGGSDMAVIGRARVRTENNCLPRDIVQVGEYLLFGYNVFIGLKTETKVKDVFSLFQLKKSDDQVEIVEASSASTFLDDASFKRDFDELYRYYKNARLLQLTQRDGKLLAGFQIGERLEDIRVFRWALSADGATATYIDNRGERDIRLPPAYDFEWIKTTREDVVNGKHPHINILDQIFIETVGGDLTVKVENNTKTGLGIYREPVDDDTQSIDDADYLYAELGSLILLKIRPYREEDWRYLVYNKLTQDVIRIDAIGSSCVQLPEDHGIVFPGGYYLQTGQYKTFDDTSNKMLFKRSIRSPNGEDVLYVFYQPEGGIVGLFAYNLIEKTLQNPIYGDGYALAEDGTMVIFVAHEEPTRVHPMQVWQTPFYSDEFASKEPPKQNFFGRVGNAELVRGISDLYAVSRIIENQSVTVQLYEELRKAALKLFDDHYWIGEEDAAAVEPVLKEIVGTAELAIDEFEKVQSIRTQSQRALDEAASEQATLIAQVRTGSWHTVEDYVTALDSIRKQRGHLATIKEYRYIDVARIESMDKELVEAESQLSGRTIEFLADEQALEPYYEKIAAFGKDVEQAQTTAQLSPIIETIEETASGLDLLSDLLASIKVDDPTVRTRIIDGISQVYSRLNQSKASVSHKQKSMGSEEAVAQFSAQFKLFSQSITNALGMADTPEACDQQMSRLLIQLEELESQFADHEEFLSDIVAKREEIYESFESHKQQLLDNRQRRAQSVSDAANRILASIERRTQKFTNADEMNTYFASDALVLKVRDFIQQLRQLDSNVQADDLESKSKAIRDQALRSLRDKSDLYESGGNVIKLGPKHRFSVNTQELDLTIIPRDNALNLHLTGTDFYQRIEDEALARLQPFWQVTLESESQEVYRAEYLAANILQAAEIGDDLDQDTLHQALLDDDALQKLVRDYAAPRYKEGYERGIHDHDAALILKVLVPGLEQADLLSFDPYCRGFAQVFWANLAHIHEQLQGNRLSYETWVERAQSALQMNEVFNSRDAADLLAQEIARAMQEFIALHPIPVTPLQLQRAADYLVQELGRERTEFICSKYARTLADELRRSLDDQSWRRYEASLEKMLGWPGARWSLSSAWLEALVNRNEQLAPLKRYIPEAAALINSDQRIDRRMTEVDLEFTVDQLMGEHRLIQQRRLPIAVDQFIEKMAAHRNEFIPAYREYLQVRQSILERERDALRLNEYKPRPLTSFVRNQLINDAYLPVIGNNLAKQMGTVGEDRRSDLSGLLMMISPPGYGKTTLMEYVASRLGLIFMKINCPSLGHDVLSLDPAQAPNATAQQELIKLNLGLEMGNNVMLYLDDIQHTHPEFLQKFISLCDGTRRIEGVWKGRTKTYDMRGRKFCVIMAGNPYTESGEVFKIPDMLANRADIYNLGDVLGGMDEQFALSYIENSLTSNPVLAPLATRDIADVYKFVKIAQGENIPSTDLSHQYSAAEVSEIVGVMKKMFQVRDTVLKVNQQYILSAAQADKYRTEPAFKLQGSYRNMNKMAEKISSVMNDVEFQQMIDDHYLGEAQLLTAGAEENLLKLAELRGTLTPETKARWEQIKADFLRNKAMGGEETDTGRQVVVQLADLVSGINGIGKKMLEGQMASESRQGKADADTGITPALLNTLMEKLQRALAENKPNVKVVNQPAPAMEALLHTLKDSIDKSIFPIVRSMDKKLEIDLRTHYNMREVSKQLADIEVALQKELKQAQGGGAVEPGKPS